MTKDVVAEAAAVARELVIGQRVVAAYVETRNGAAWSALAKTVLDGLDLHVVPVRPERRENAAVVGHVAVPVRCALPDAHCLQVRRLQRGDLPLVDAVIRDAAETDLAVRPRLPCRPLDAFIEISRLARREVIDESR